MKKLVSVIIPTLNSGRTLDACLRSLRNQGLGERLEIIIIDGGSKDKTREIARQFRVKWIEEKTAGPEEAKAVGLTKVESEYVLFVASDNILQSGWLEKGLRILNQDSSLAGVYSWRYSFDKSDSSLNRYFALIGGNDPIAIYLGKADKQGYHTDEWSLQGEMEDRGEYFRVKFDLLTIPTLGDNGFLIKKKVLEKAKISKSEFSHLDVFWDLVEMGFRTYGVIKTEIKHDTGESLRSYLEKRWRYVNQLYWQKLSQRRYQWLKTKEDKIRLIKAGLKVGTGVEPIWFVIRGMINKWDWAWIWHIPLVYSLSIIYIFSWLKFEAGKLFNFRD